MNLNLFSQLLRQHTIVALDRWNDNDQKPSRIYIAKLNQKINDLTKVILIDFESKIVAEPEMIGSYAKFGCPIKRIDPERDNIAEMKEQIEQLPESTKINLIRLMEGKQDVEDEGFLNFYDLDKYLFETVNKRFQENGYLNETDFFCIVIWKANRVKSIIAKMLLKEFDNLETASRTISKTLRNENFTDYHRFKYLLELGFRLPMLSAILTVLFPEKFLVYDFRICSHPEMQQFKKLENPIKDSKLYWTLYEEYIMSVIQNTPSWMSLRQKDYNTPQKSDHELSNKMYYF